MPVEVRHSGGYRIAIDSAGGRITGLRLLGAAGDEPAGVRLAGFQYDGNHNLSGVLDAADAPLRFTYDEAGRITSWTDRNQHRYRYLYDRAGRCVQTRGDGGFLDAVFAYDGDRRTTTVRDSLGHVTVYQLNDLGQVTTETDALGGVTSSVWNRHDLLLSRTDALGRTTCYDYDADGNPAAVTLADGTVTSVVHNDLRQPVQVVEPDGSVWRYEYDEHGNLLALADPAGAETRYAYGEFGQLAAISDATGRTTAFETDAAGLVVSITDADGSVSTCVRDAFGNPQTLTDPLGGVITCGWTVDGRPAWRTSPEGRTEWWKYDAEGNLLEHIDETGASERFEYTFFNRVSARTGADGARYEFEYDTELRVLGVTNPHGLRWSYEYDAIGRLVSEQDFNGRTVRYKVDAVGELVARTNGAGQTVRYRRDALGRTLEQDAHGVLTTFSYDPAGRLLHSSRPGVELSIEYDAAKRPVAETCNGLTLAHGYDRLGRRTARRTPDGAESSWSYGPNGQIEALTVGQRSLSFGYDRAGREVSRRLGALSLHQAWDGADRLVEQRVSVTIDPSPQALQRRTFGYRSDGYLTSITDSRSGSRSFSLDPAGRVTSVTGENWREAYAYDGAGNLAAADWPNSDPTRSAAVGDRSYTGALLQRAGRVGYEYDGQGRLIRQTRRLLSGGSRVWQYEWDADDRLIALTTPHGDVWRYLYDPFGRRVAKVRMTPDGTGVVERTVFVWDGDVLAEQARTDLQTGTVQVTTWDWDQDHHRVLTQTVSLRDASQDEVDRRFYAIVTDMVGTPTELVDEQGTIAWRARTTLWGDVPAAQEDAADCPLRFPGQYLDRESDLHYNLYRYYDPQTARYLSPDPLGLEPAPDPYAYVGNPLAETDPLGLAKKPKCEIIIRYGSEAEAKQSLAANDGKGGLVPKFRPHERQPKWIARGDADLSAGNLGQAKHYTHKMEFRCKPGTYDWLKQWETKPTNEPGRFELPAGEIERFNKRVEETTVTKVERGNAGKRRRR
ncbi:RHS repeat-associated core domain-containing protein [Kitasatospora sp. NPDC056138]|uniref:RHS repeat-associated core domain-containing protein n=1 Tax=Kitasatospora sp. NPDC056138 TaxID=3345724 RepID=UPI0035DF32DC